MEQQQSELLGAAAARRAAKGLQEHERAELRAAGRKKLDELRLLKAAAARLLQAEAHSQQPRRMSTPFVQPQGSGPDEPGTPGPPTPQQQAAQHLLQQQQQQQLQQLQQLHQFQQLQLQQQQQQQQPQSQPQQHGSAGSSPAARVAQLTSSLAAPLPPLPRLSRTSSASSSPSLSRSSSLSSSMAPPMPLGYRIARSSSAGSYGPERSTLPMQRLSRSNSTGSYCTGLCRMPSSCGPAPLHATTPGSGPWSPGPAPRASHASYGQDPLVEMLLTQVSTLMVDRQQLAARCGSLERENEQLAELVGHLTVTMEEQQQQTQLQQELLVSQLRQPLSPCPTPARRHSSSLAEPLAAEGGAALVAASAALQQEHAHAEERQMAWLARTPSTRSEVWAQWQQRLPLEPASSASSSGMALALDEARS